MAENHNNFSCIGRITNDLILKNVGEHKLVEFSIAVNGRKDDDVLFMNCKIWNKQAEILSQYTKKGSKLFISGSMKQERWKSDDGKNQSKIICNVSSFEFLDSKPKEETGLGQVTTLRPEDNPFSGDELPF